MHINSTKSYVSTMSTYICMIDTTLVEKSFPQSTDLCDGPGKEAENVVAVQPKKKPASHISWITILKPMTSRMAEISNIDSNIRRHRVMRKRVAGGIGPAEFTCQTSAFLKGLQLCREHTDEAWRQLTSSCIIHSLKQALKLASFINAFIDKQY